MNRELKHISNSFQTDSLHLLEKACSAYESCYLKQRTGFQAKIVVDLYMSIECGLKSLLCSRNPTQDADTALQNIFKFGHNLKKLIKAGKPLPLSKSDLQFLYELNDKGVSLRYDLDLFSLVSSELLSNDKVTYHIDSLYVEELMRISRLVYDEANSVYTASFPNNPRLLTEKEREQEVFNLRSLKKIHAKTRNMNCVIKHHHTRNILWNEAREIGLYVKAADPFGFDLIDTTRLCNFLGYAERGDIREHGQTEQWLANMIAKELQTLLPQLPGSLSPIEILLPTGFLEIIGEPAGRVLAADWITRFG